MPSDIDIAWFAGLFEGEGCFEVARSKHPRRRPGLRATVKMTDYDVIAAAAQVFPGAGKVRRCVDARKEQFSDCYKVSWYGLNAERLMLTVLPLMGQRRTAKICSCLGTPNLSHRKAIV